jgi:hypothetical protein
MYEMHPALFFKTGCYTYVLAIFSLSVCLILSYDPCACVFALLGRMECEYKIRSCLGVALET